jgi:hypothetical protein
MTTEISSDGHMMIRMVVHTHVSGKEAMFKTLLGSDKWDHLVLD